MSETNILEPQIETKKKVGRPRKYEKGARQNEIDTKYSSTYYREHKDKKIVCDFCNKEIVYIYKHQHLKSKLCQSLKQLREQLTKPTEVKEELKEEQNNALDA